MKKHLQVKLSPFLSDVLLTGLTSFVIIIAIVFTTRFLALGLGPDNFGAYSLARRFIAFVLPFSTLSLGISLTRFIAISPRNETERLHYLVSSMFIILIFSIGLIIVMYFFRNQLTILIFHDKKYLSLLYSSLSMIIGSGFFTILYSYYRGIQRIAQANLWRIVMIGIIPIIISYVYAPKGDVSLIVFLMGGSLFICVLPIAYILRHINLSSLDNYRLTTKNLLKHGIPRTPGGIAFAGLLVIGPFLAPYFGTLKDAGYLVIGQSIFRIMEAGLVAFGIVALPKFSQLVAKGNVLFIKDKIEDVITMIVHVGLFSTVQLYIWINEIIVVWLGKDYSDIGLIMKIFLVSLCPYLGYVVLRSIIDAIEKRAINTYNLLVSLVFMTTTSLLLGYLGLGVEGLAMGTTAGFMYLGVATNYFLIRKYHIAIERMKLMMIVGLNVLFAAINIILKKYLSLYFQNIDLLILIFFIEIVLFGSYLWILYENKMRWVLEIKIRVFSIRS